MTEVLAGSAPAAAGWVRCEGCGELVYAKRLRHELGVCPGCGRYERMGAGERVDLLLDRAGRTELVAPATLEDPLSFTASRAYREQLGLARGRTGLDEAVRCLEGRVEGHPVVLAAMDFAFLGGSLGCTVGERITHAAEHALRRGVPLVIVTASGGARMQEGVLSLMQMAKTAQALAALDAAGVLTVTVVTDPTYGGVAASFANLTDVVLAEPGARLGFAGPRVIEQTIRRSLPEGFQTAEFLLRQGFLDAVVHRRDLRGTLARLLACASPVHAVHDRPDDPVVTDPAAVPARDAWATARLARNVARPTTLDYVAHLVDGFVELHGDRVGGECPSVVAGLGLFAGRPVAVVGHQKGHTIRELSERNFGMPSPSGYRKAARVMRLAAKLGLPVVTLVDTPGAYPGPEAEERGQAVAIAEGIREMSRLPVPVVTVVTGEGGSGGALALAVADRVLVLENAVYSVISPEGCASILWQSASEAPRAAEALGITASDLLRRQVIDGVVPEPPGGASADHAEAARLLGAAVLAALADLEADHAADVAAGRPHAERLLHERWWRFRRFGLADPGAVRRELSTGPPSSRGISS